MIHRSLDDPDDKTKLTLLYANNREEDILLKEELEGERDVDGIDYLVVFDAHSINRVGFQAPGSTPSPLHTRGTTLTLLLGGPCWLCELFDVEGQNAATSRRNAHHGVRSTRNDAICLWDERKAEAARRGRRVVEAARLLE